MLRPASLLAAFGLLLLTACSGSGNGVAVKWQAQTSEAVVSQEVGGNGGTSVATVVYVSVGGKTVVHDATVRLNDDDAGQTLGMNIGTVTPVRTEFDGPTRVWRLGDLEPGKRYGLPLSLFFSSTHVEAAPDSLKLAVEVASPDLASPIRSNVLAVDLKR